LNSSFRHSAGNLTPFEAEEFVKALRPIAVADLGSERWMRQHEQLEQLNLQAHHSALSKHDEFVVEALITYEKVRLQSKILFSELRIFCLFLYILFVLFLILTPNPNRESRFPSSCKT
jgi:hypothetical protein